MRIRTLLPCHLIPLGSTVTKRVGEKHLIIRDRVRVFSDTGPVREILASPGVVFLVSDSGDANAVSDNTEVLWVVNTDDLYAWIQDLEDPE